LLGKEWHIKIRKDTKWNEYERKNKQKCVECSLLKHIKETTRSRFDINQSYYVYACKNCTDCCDFCKNQFFPGEPGLNCNVCGKGVCGYENCENSNECYMAFMFECMGELTDESLGALICYDCWNSGKRICKECENFYGKKK